MKSLRLALDMKISLPGNDLQKKEIKQETKGFRHSPYRADVVPRDTVSRGKSPDCSQTGLPLPPLPDPTFLSGSLPRKRAAVLAATPAGNIPPTELWYKYVCFARA